MSRLWQDGKALQVRTDDNLPTAIHWRDVWYTVQHIALHWQIDVNWWQARIYRDYYKVLADGMVLVIYHDLIANTWAVQRIYD